MGTGIGKDCKRCGEQLNYDDGFDDKEEYCKRCKSIVDHAIEEGVTFRGTAMEDIRSGSWLIIKMDPETGNMNVRNMTN